MAGQGRHPWDQLDYDWTGLSWCVGPAWNGLGDSDEADRKQVHDIIMDELCLGMFTDERDAYVRIIEKLAADGCDAVALVCTEIPLLITQDISPLPILDSHAYWLRRLSRLQSEKVNARMARRPDRLRLPLAFPRACARGALAGRRGSR